jgi:hypothetical protein
MLLSKLAAGYTESIRANPQDCDGKSMLPVPWRQPDRTPRRNSL